MVHNSRESRQVISKKALILLGVLFGIAIAEIALRVAGYSYPRFYTPDDSRGYALLPNAEGWYRIEGESYISINSQGLRDREHSLTKAPNTLRIAVVGDSYAEALPVDMKQAFWAVMERNLASCGALNGRQLEVINFGVSGYGTAQELITIKEQVWKYSPDVVMLAFTTGNDITDNSRVFKGADEIPYFDYQNNKLTLDDSFRRSWSFRARQSSVSRLGRWFRDHSRVIQAAIQAHRGLKIILASWRGRGIQPQSSPSTKDQLPPQKSDLLARSHELGTDNLIYLEPANSEWINAWRVTEGLLLAIRDDVKSRGAKLVVVTLSNGAQLIPEAEAREDYKKRFGITDLFYPDNRIQEFALREGLDAVILAPTLLEFVEQNKTHLHGFGQNIGNGHWNATGHRVAGEVLAKKICEGAFLK